MSAPPQPPNATTGASNSCPISPLILRPSAAGAPTLNTTPHAPQPSQKSMSSFFEVARLNAAFEAAWEKAAADMKVAKTVRERQQVREEEAFECEIAAQTVVTKEGFELYRQRMLLLRWGTQVGEWEDKFWVQSL